MAETKTTALIERPIVGVQRIQEMAGPEITTPQAYAERIRALQGQAHILSPFAAVGAIAPSHVINTMVVVIDPSVDAKSGRGADVYHQPSIHKSKKIGTENGKAIYEPLEVSLNKIGLQKILAASGASIYPPTREFRERYWWIVTHEADLLTFDGRYVRLPPGTASVDLRDGSPDCGEWTPEAWAEAVRIAEEQKKKTPPDDQWKIKPNVGGWTKERVLQARKFGLELAETKSLNRLARNLGFKQVYTIEELQKPFIVFRAAYIPDVTDPDVRRQLTAASLGARYALYPGSEAQRVSLHDGSPISHAMGDPTQLIESEVVTPEPAERMETAAPPTEAKELSFDEPAEKAEPTAPVDLYHVTRVLQDGDGASAKYYVETKEGITLYTPDLAMAKICAAAKKDGLQREIPTERVMVGGNPYRQIIEVSAVGGVKL